VQKTLTISHTALGPILILLLTVAYAWCIWSIRNSANFGSSEEEKIAYQIKALNDHSIINMTDEHGVITYVNDKFIHTTGYSRDELIGQNLTLLLPKSIAAQYNFARGYVLTGKSWSGEVRMKDKGGQNIWAHTTVAPRLGKRGKVIGTIAIQTDTTQSKIDAHDRTMRKSMHLLRDEVYMFEADTLRYIYLNKAAMDYCGWDEKTYRKKTIVDKRRDLLNDGVFDRDAFYDRARPLIDGEAKEIEFILEDYKQVREVKLQLIRPVDGPPHFLSIGRDISERRAFEKSKDEFISTISHELRTPVTSIKGALGLVLSGATGELCDKTHSMLDIAHRNSDRLTLIINDILDLEKIAAGKMEFNIEPVNIAEIINDAIAANKAYAERLNVSFVGIGLGKQTECFCDSDRVFQIMNNLLSNAAKFSKDDGEVAVTLSSGDDTICVSVEDFGKGIPKEAQSSIFDRFTQADSSDHREKSGTGLGLSIVKALVERQGGKIYFTSEIDKGSKFSFELPKIDKTPKNKSTTQLMVAAE
jgi:PAS domain S-box-containing protein